jgi:hypothetical protein
LWTEVRVNNRGGELLKGLNDAFIIPPMAYKYSYLIDLQYIVSSIESDGMIE